MDHLPSYSYSCPDSYRFWRPPSSGYGMVPVPTDTPLMYRVLIHPRSPMDSESIHATWYQVCRVTAGAELSQTNNGRWCIGGRTQRTRTAMEGNPLIVLVFTISRSQILSRATSKIVRKKEPTREGQVMPLLPVVNELICIYC
jgi:hypothetical protein